jgi:hypothetical protein
MECVVDGVIVDSKRQGGDDGHGPIVDAMFLEASIDLSIPGVGEARSVPSLVAFHQLLDGVQARTVSLERHIPEVGKNRSARVAYVLVGSLAQSTAKEVRAMGGNGGYELIDARFQEAETLYRQSPHILLSIDMSLELLGAFDLDELSLSHSSYLSVPGAVTSFDRRAGALLAG